MSANAAEAQLHPDEGAGALAEVLPLRHKPSHPEDWREEGGVYISPDIDDALLEGFNLNPIVDKSVLGLGDIALHKVREASGRRKTDRETRTHRLYTFELNGYAHAVEITDPAHGKAQ